MLNRDRLLLSDYTMDPEFDNNFDSYEDLDYDFGKDIDPDPDAIEMDELDGELWLD